MSWYGTHQQTRSTKELEDDLRWAQDEAARLRQEREEQQETQRREREERLRERQQMCAEHERTADTWPEALAKQAYLFAAEIYLEDDDDPSETHPFTTGAAACKRALELWNEKEKKVQPQIDELERRLAELRAGIRFAVADALDGENLDNQVTQALREYDEDTVSEWLNW